MRDIRSYDVFRLSDQLVLEVYRITSSFPKDELYGLTSQMRRAAYSIPMNLVEGGVRHNEREFARYIALGSCEEIRYQAHLAKDLGYITPEVRQELETDYEKVKQMLTRLLHSVTGPAGKTSRSP